jgi:16S rRNA (guanine966-N2)-methyltransferase
MSAVASELADAAVLDLFAGSGALGLEALSRGAARVTFVEAAPAALRVLRANLALLAAEPQVEVVKGDAMRYAASLEPRSFDVAFADPPYGKGLAAALAISWAERPFSRLLCLEHRYDDEVPAGAALRQKRYGDTVLTFFAAPE